MENDGKGEGGLDKDTTVLGEIHIPIGVNSIKKVSNGPLPASAARVPGGSHIQGRGAPSKCFQVNHPRPETPGPMAPPAMVQRCHPKSKSWRSRGRICRVDVET